MPVMSINTLFKNMDNQYLVQKNEGPKVNLLID